MKKTYIQVLIFFLVLFYFSGLAISEQGIALKPEAQILHQAKKILSNLKSTRYNHKTYVDENSGTYFFDCSGLICYILDRAAPESLASVSIDPPHRHARANNFYNTFSNAPAFSPKNGWLKIIRLIDAEPGDLIAWRKDPAPQKGNTGHIIIVLEKPVEEKDGFIRIIVLDSSQSKHAEDSRRKGTSGVGFGTMWFRVNDTGEPLAFHWSNRKKKQIEVPIAIGRAIEM